MRERDLASACGWAVEQLGLMDSEASHCWNNDRLDAEVGRYNAVVERATIEPAASPEELRAKAALAFAALDAAGTLNEANPDVMLAAAVLQEVAGRT
ncbi:hypothetical protein [Methylobacterium nigriterrae]|uniref:hypothetical protein n=1 Tax=Methylobacterium nigriterrae TaxID=3127512 RepID=UPI0030138224